MKSQNGSTVKNIKASNRKRKLVSDDSVQVSYIIRVFEINQYVCLVDFMTSAGYLLTLYILFY